MNKIGAISAFKNDEKLHSHKRLVGDLVYIQEGTMNLNDD